MSHDPHHAHEGYTPEQVLYDGCHECYTRAQRDDHGITALDMTTFERAWERAADWHRHGLADLAANEIPMFRVLQAVMVQLERRGLPYGYLPRGNVGATLIEAASPGLLDAYGETGAQAGNYDCDGKLVDES